MAAETLSLAGEKVVLFDRMASPARKFLMAGRGGLNLTHSESWDTFKTRYAPLPLLLDRALDDFNATHLRDWCQTLGIDTFQGSSGRIFPVHMKASPLLRAWLKRLEKLGVEMNTRHTWQGWADDGTLLFDHAGTQHISVADDFSLGRRFFQNGQEITRQTPGQRAFG